MVGRRTLCVESPDRTEREGISLNNLFGGADAMSRRTGSHTRWAARGATGALCAAALLVPTAPVSAQDDPYGSTTTTTAPGGFAPACTLDLTVVGPGSVVTATVSSVPLGATVRILIGGEEAGSSEPPGNGNGNGHGNGNGASAAVVVEPPSGGDVPQ
jgi:hypothetical protein